MFTQFPELKETLFKTYTAISQIPGMNYDMLVLIFNDLTRTVPSLMVKMSSSRVWKLCSPREVMHDFTCRADFIVSTFENELGGYCVNSNGMSCTSLFDSHIRKECVNYELSLSRHELCVLEDVEIIRSFIKEYGKPVSQVGERQYTFKYLEYREDCDGFATLTYEEMLGS